MSQINLTDYDFSGLSDLELGILQSKARRFPEDKHFADAVLRELGKREKVKSNNKEVNKCHNGSSLKTGNTPAKAK